MRIALPPRIAVAAFSDRDPHARLVDLGGETMGTRWHVRLASPPTLDVAATDAAIVALLDTLVGEMSHWAEGSLLSRFNRAGAGTWHALPPAFAHVVAEGLAIAAASDGAFDPAAGRLTDLYGLGPRRPMGPPDDDAIGAALAGSGWRRMRFDPAARRLHQPGGLALDLSGIAKGHAVDAVADLLAARGIGHCLVEIGGELTGRGVRPDGEPWWVDLEAPPGSPLPPLRLALHDIAVATSGDYRKGRHTLDPRTGMPVSHALTSVSVIHETALAADAWATALMVQGAARGMATAARLAIAARFVERDGEMLRETLSSALAAMLED